MRRTASVGPGHRRGSARGLRQAGASALALLLSSGCAHGPSLSDRLRRPPLVVEVAAWPGEVRLHAPEVAAAVETAREFPNMGGGGNVVFLPAVILVHAISSAVEASRIEAFGRSRWLAHLENREARRRSPEALAAWVGLLGSVTDLDVPLRQGALDAAREVGQPVADRSSDLLHVTLRDVQVLYSPSDPRVRVAATLDAVLTWEGVEVGRLLGAVVDPRPRLLDEYLRDDALEARRALGALARAAGELAVARLVAKLPAGPVERGRHANLCGPGPARETPDGGLEPLPGFHPLVPLDVDPAHPAIAWEPWAPRGGPVPAGAVVGYGFRLWGRAIADGPGDEPRLLHRADDLAEPRQDLAGLVEPGGVYRWAARATVRVDGRAFVGDWSSAPRELRLDAAGRQAGGEAGCQAVAARQPLRLRVLPVGAAPQRR